MTTHEAIARYHKAERLADVLESVHGTAADAKVLATEGRRMAEQLAMVRVASDATWALTAMILEDRSKLRAAIADLPADPFAAFSS
jgi:hypothetical protein